jgi:hypothetical protein
VLDPAALEAPRDRVEHEGDLLEGGLGRGRGDDRVGNDLLLRGDAALLDLDGVEVLGRPVAVGVRAEELELRLDDVVLDEALRDEGRGLVDALADHEGLVLPATGRHARTRLTRGLDGLLVVDALDRVLAAERGLRALALDVRAIRLEVEVYGFSHGDRLR